MHLQASIVLFSRQNSESLDISHVFLPLTIAELSTLKYSPVFGPPCSVGIMICMCILHSYIILDWLQIKAGSDVTRKIEELQIDGDLLLLLTEKNLQQDLGVNNAITRKRFYS